MIQKTVVDINAASLGYILPHLSLVARVTGSEQNEAPETVRLMLEPLILGQELPPGRVEARVTKRWGVSPGHPTAHVTVTLVPVVDAPASAMTGAVGRAILKGSDPAPTEPSEFARRVAATRRAPCACPRCAPGGPDPDPLSPPPPWQPGDPA